MADRQNIVSMLRHELRKTQVEMSFIKARYEAAQTYPTNENHWAKADSLSPDAANDPLVRARLRSRSRFEVVENNPYLNGTLISLCNDFAGSGVRLRITDMDVPREERQRIEKQWKRWQKKIKLRKLLWQLRMDKAVSGEGFAVQIYNPRLKHPVKLDFRIVEADCITNPWGGISKDNGIVVNRAISPNMADGIKLDQYGFPVSYHILNHHPGGSGMIDGDTSGKWIPAEHVIHVFRPMRSWHRGIPELTPSIPLCAVARRYTMALVRCAEIQACLAAVLESDIPNYRNLQTPPTRTVEIKDENGQVIGTEQVTDEDDGPMFDLIPIEMGSFNLLPQGFRFKTWDRVPVGQQYDLFIGALMREIFRPLLVPYNMGIGSSKDSNMASGVLDAGLYTQGQKAERFAFEDDVLEPLAESWYEIGCLTDSYFTERGLMPVSKRELPDHEFGWDEVTIKHTDPTKIANAIVKQREAGVYTDRYIQEELLGKDYEEWQDEQLEQAKFIATLDKIRGCATAQAGTKTSVKDDSGIDSKDDETEDENDEE
ncbi:MAG: phage portal protein [Planctomycetia bacterium]|nr:phage portal protein [Planctomycetia bacterium]